jgi:hypothetical protein
MICRDYTSLKHGIAAVYGPSGDKSRYVSLFKLYLHYFTEVSGQIIIFFGVVRAMGWSR